MSKEISINCDDLANMVISKLVDRICNPEFIKDAINKKFSEDLRLTMLGCLEDMDMSLITSAVRDAMIAAVTDESFMDALIIELNYHINSGRDGASILARSIVNNSDVNCMIDNKMNDLRIEMDNLRGELYAAIDAVRSERGL